MAGVFGLQYWTWETKRVQIMLYSQYLVANTHLHEKICFMSAEQNVMTSIVPVFSCLVQALLVVPFTTSYVCSASRIHMALANKSF